MKYYPYYYDEKNFGIESEPDDLIERYNIDRSQYYNTFEETKNALISLLEDKIKSLSDGRDKLRKSSGRFDSAETHENYEI